MSIGLFFGVSERMVGFPGISRSQASGPPLIVAPHELQVNMSEKTKTTWIPYKGSSRAHNVIPIQKPMFIGPTIRDIDRGSNSVPTRTARS